MPLSLLCVTCIFVWSILSCGKTQAEVIEIYRISALRVVGLLGLLVPALRAAMDVAGDVVFYLAPAGSGLSTKALLQRRFWSCLAAVSETFRGQPLTVLAHSQGSVLAVECLSDQRWGVDRLVTMGSPITTLYDEFLGLSIPSGGSPALVGIEWTNLYRTGDFLGGRIEGHKSIANVRIGPGGHTNYWSDRRIAPFLRRCGP
jgi:pimeloyl-ACP methyl ester carboxylesterase